VSNTNKTYEGNKLRSYCLCRNLTCMLFMGIVPLMYLLKLLKVEEDKSPKITVEY